MIYYHVVEIKYQQRCFCGLGLTRRDLNASSQLDLTLFREVIFLRIHFTISSKGENVLQLAHINFTTIRRWCALLTKPVAV